MQSNGKNLLKDYNNILISKVNDVYAHIHCESSMARELNEYFTFYVPGYKFMPQFRNKMWDGKIRLFDLRTNQIYYGLISHLENFSKERNYNIVYNDNIEANEEFSLTEANDFVSTLNLPFSARDYQLNAFTYAIRNRRALLLSPTASGKSLIIYLIARYYSCKTLIVVPTISLVAQLYKDFEDYGFDSNKHVHQIMSGAEKQTSHLITISTWQSIYKLPKKWFSQFDLVVGDEAHLFKAKSLISVLTKLETCKYRFGLTGTLDGTQTHRLVLEGLFGKVKKITTTKELIDTGKLAKFKIKCLILSYEDSIRNTCKNYKYQDEIDFLISCNERNIFIRNLANSLKGNTLILYQLVEKHGKVLYNLIKEKANDREVSFIHGGVNVDDREHVRKITEEQSNAIIVASYGTFSTGINIKNLHNIIFASPSKSKIRTLQSIGRGLRIGDNKEVATLYDISDDITYKSRKNFTIQHFSERMKFYNEEKFDYKIYTIKLRKKDGR